MRLRRKKRQPTCGELASFESTFDSSNHHDNYDIDNDEDARIIEKSNSQREGDQRCTTENVATMTTTCWPGANKMLCGSRTTYLPVARWAPKGRQRAEHRSYKSTACNHLFLPLNLRLVSLVFIIATCAVVHLKPIESLATTTTTTTTIVDQWPVGAGLSPPVKFSRHEDNYDNGAVGSSSGLSFTLRADTSNNGSEDLKREQSQGPRRRQLEERYQEAIRKESKKPIVGAILTSATDYEASNFSTGKFSNLGEFSIT